MKIQLGQDLASVKDFLYLLFCSLFMSLTPQAWGSPGDLEIKLNSRTHSLRDTFTTDVWVYAGNSDIQSLSLYISYHTESLSLLNWEIDPHDEIDLLLVESHNEARGIVGFEGGFISPKSDSLHMLRLSFQVKAASDSSFIAFHFADNEPGTEVFNSSTESIIQGIDISPLYLDISCPEEPAKAGSDQDLCGNAAQLEANLPESYQGSWRVLSGEGGSFTDDSSPFTFFVGRRGETYRLIWHIEGYTCTKSSDTLSVSFASRPPSLNAGRDQVVFGDLTYLDAIPSSFFATGTWRLLTEDLFATIRNPEDPKSGFIGRVGHTYQLEWAETREVCPIEPDTVTIEFKHTPKAFAGVDQVVVNEDETRLRADLPDGNLEGFWRILSGGIGVFSDRSSPNATFKGRMGLTYTLEWNLRYQGAILDQDTVRISFETKSRDFPRSGRISLFTPPNFRFLFRDRRIHPFLRLDLPEVVFGNIPRKKSTTLPREDSTRSNSFGESDSTYNLGASSQQNGRTHTYPRNSSRAIDFYPNPVLNKRFSVYISGENSNNFTFNIFNSNGQELLRGKWDSMGIHEVELNNFPPGVYTLFAVDSEGQKFVEKVFVK